MKIDRWVLYEMLKLNPKHATIANIKAIETMEVKELREGVIEYIIAKIKYVG